MRPKYLLSALLGLLWMGLSTTAAATVTVEGLNASHIFGKSLTFQAQVTDPNTVEKAQLTFKLIATGKSFVIPAEVQPDGFLKADYAIQPQDRITAFSTLEYWFTLETPTGNVESPKADHIYADDRYPWQSTSEGDGITAYWSEGDLAFGQSILDAAHQTKDDFTQYLDLPYPEELEIYVYPTTSALQSALEITNTPWVSGHADIDGNLIVVAIPIGFDEQLDIQRDIPHEVTHIRLGLYLNGETGSLPAWYSEGVASLAERYPAPEYWQILQSAYQNDTLIPLEDLCPVFPNNTSQAALAYAEADSFLHFLFERYGKIGLQNLLNVYNHGYPCVGGVEEALGTSLDELEAAWIASTFRAAPIPTGPLFLWIVLGIVVLAAPIGLSLRSMRQTRESISDGG